MARADLTPQPPQHGKPRRLGRTAELSVEARESGKQLGQSHGRGKMQRIERPQARTQGDRAIADVVVERDQCDPTQNALDAVMIQSAPMCSGVQFHGEQSRRDGTRRLGEK
ncbi:MAG TPA: hypothetical protein VFN24_07575 [Microbacterium sp.]|nr:hypothetical protein [Microbacterium sp.]